jgi:hypothetical protein
VLPLAGPQVLYSLQRATSSTNQRIGFSIEPCGRHLATGGSDGHVRVRAPRMSLAPLRCCGRRAPRLFLRRRLSLHQRLPLDLTSLPLCCAPHTPHS